jgi:hypothetical protein
MRLQSSTLQANAYFAKNTHFVSGHIHFSGDISLRLIIYCSTEFYVFGKGSGKRYEEEGGRES